MLKEYIKKSQLSFYPLLCPNRCFSHAMVYTPNDIFSFFYNTYSNNVDKDYLLELYDSRENNPPDKEITEVWGQDMGYLHNAVKSEYMKGIIVKHFLTKEPIRDLIVNHRVQYGNLIYNKSLISYPKVIFSGLKQPKGDIQQLICKLCDFPFIIYQWKEILMRLLKILAAKSIIETTEGENLMYIRRMLNVRKDLVTRMEDKYVVNKRKEKIFRFW